MTHPLVTRSKLESAIRLAKKGFFVFPLCPNTKTPLEKGWQRHSTRDEKRIRDWFAGKDYNIGIDCGKYIDDTQSLIVVDLDNKNGKQGKIVFNDLFVFEGLDCGKFFAQFTPNNGEHYIYSVNRTDRLGTKSVGEGIDLLGVGNYVVGSGSSLDGVYYTDDNNAVGPVPGWLLDLLVDIKSKKEKQVALVQTEDCDLAVAALMAREFLSTRQKVSQGSRNHTLYVFACKLKDFGLPHKDAEEMLIYEFSDLFEPELDPNEMFITIKSAYTHGINDFGVENPKKVFEKVEDDSLPPLDRIKDKYKVMLKNGSFGIIRMLDGDFTFLNKKDFLAEAAHYGGYTVNKKFIPFAQAFFEEMLAKEKYYVGYTFDPSYENPKSLLNLFTGFKIQPARKEELSDVAVRGFEMFIDHLQRNICKNEDAKIKWLFSFIAHLIQYPGEHAQSALVLKGKQGTGKSIVGDVLAGVIGEKYRSKIFGDALFSEFNGYLAEKLITQIEEVSLTDKRKVVDKLKSEIATKYVTVNKKFEQQRTIKNCARFILTTNHDFVLHAETEARRFTIFEVGNDNIQDYVFFEAMMRGLEEGGYRLVYSFFLKYQVNKPLIAKALKTSESFDETVNSLDSVIKFWIDCYLVKSIGGTLGWPEYLKSDSIYTAYLEFCKAEGINSPKMLKNFTYTTNKMFESGYNKHTKKLHLPEHHETINLISDYTKIPISFLIQGEDDGLEGESD